MSFSGFSQTPEAFNYQAIVRNDDGEVIREQNVTFRISILEGSINGASVYSELHEKTTNSFGLVVFEIGKGDQPTSDFSTINWESNTYFLKVELDPEGGNDYAEMGTTQFLSVPYSLHSKSTSNIDDADADPNNEIQDLSLSGDLLTISGGNTIILPYDSAYWKMKENNIVYSKGNVGIGSENPKSRLEVKGDISFTEKDTLFAVKDKAGNVVFAVFPDGAKLYVDNTAKGNVGGFAISGRSANKSGEYEIMRVSSDSTRIYVSEGVKDKVGGFAISGRSANKTGDYEILKVTSDSTRIYIPEVLAKGNVGGFAISGRSANKSLGMPVFVATNDSTRIYTKSTTGGFGVRDNSTGQSESYLQLTPQNYFIGHNSGINNSTGLHNLFLGYESGRWNNTGGSNVFIGPEAGRQNSSGFGNIFIGNKSGYHNTDIDSGSFTHPDGVYNVYVGYNSGENILNGKYNTFVGYATCASGTEGNFNTYIGNQAGNQSNGSDNVFLGVKAGELARTGSNNVMLGNYSGHRCYSGSKNVFIGYYAGYNEDSDNKLYIENSSASSPLIYGDFTDGSELVQINGDLCYTGSLSQCSDLHYKKNIRPLVNAIGLVKKLNPVYFNWKKDRFKDFIPSSKKQVGLIAQEVEKVIPELVSENSEGYKSVDYSKMTPILIESVKEQQSQIEKLKKENQELKKRLQTIEELLRRDE
jgi:hypothetical protein